MLDNPPLLTSEHRRTRSLLKFILTHSVMLNGT